MEFNIWNDNSRPVRYIEAYDGMYIQNGSKNLLKDGDIYIVEDVIVQDWYTDVYLKGFDEPFNSVIFEEVGEEQEEDNDCDEGVSISEDYMDLPNEYGELLDIIKELYSRKCVESGSKFDYFKHESWDDLCDMGIFLINKLRAFK